MTAGLVVIWTGKWNAYCIVGFVLHLLRSLHKAFMKGRQNLEGIGLKPWSITFKQTHQVGGCSQVKREKISHKLEAVLRLAVSLLVNNEMKARKSLLCCFSLLFILY